METNYIDTFLGAVKAIDRLDDERCNMIERAKKNKEATLLQKRILDESIFYLMRNLKSLEQEYSLDDIALAVKAWWYKNLGGRKASRRLPHFDKYLRVHAEEVDNEKRREILVRMGVSPERASILAFGDPKITKPKKKKNGAKK